MYFWNYYEFPAAAICVSSTNVTKTEVSCSSDAACDTLFSSQLAEELQSVSQGNPEFDALVAKISQELVNEVSFCEGTCNARVFHQESPEEPCLTEDKKIEIRVTPKQALALAGSLEK